MAIFSFKNPESTNPESTNPESTNPESTNLESTNPEFEFDYLQFWSNDGLVIFF